MSNLDASLHDLMTFAKAYSALGTSVQEQMNDLLDGDDEMNPNAIRAVKGSLGGSNDELDEMIDQYLGRA